MATLLSHSPRLFLRLLKPKTLLPRTPTLLSPSMASPSPPHVPWGNPPPGFGPSSWNSALCTYSSDHRSSSVAGASFLSMERGRAASPDVVQVSSDRTTKLAQKGNSETNLDTRTVKIMTYNVWFREDVELPRRMYALGDLIQRHSPDLICLQAVLQHSDGKVSIGGVTMVLATSHLESPCPGPPTWDQMNSDERVAQAKTSLRILGGGRPRNVIFCGDMNWDDGVDGPFPLPAGWVDAWAELRPGEDGWTPDTRANAMLSTNNKLQKRLDRFVCRLADFEMDGVEMIGKEALPGVSYVKVKTRRGVARELTLPSDHFGLLLRVRQAGSASSD